MNHSILKNCLNNEFFEANKEKLRAELFEDQLKELFTIITELHDKFDKDVTTLELFTYWKSKNPTSTSSWTEEMGDQVDLIAAAEDIDQAVAVDVIENLWRQHTGLDIANLGIRMSEGDSNAMDTLTTLIDRVGDGYLPDDYGEHVTPDIYKMIANETQVSRYTFNIETLAKHVSGIARGEFAIIAAYSNVGKTSLAVSLCASPEGFCHQGAKVSYIANEETADRTSKRALCACTGLEEKDLKKDPEETALRSSAINGRLNFMDAQGWDVQKLEGYLNKERPDVCIIDLADKISLTQKFNSGHERLKELYYRLRECAKKYDCAMIVLSQANGDAENKTKISMSMLEGSRVAKQGEADLLLGVGALDPLQNPEETARWINVMKNKITGWHGTVQCNLLGKVSRYVV